MCEFCGCAGRSTRDRPIKKTTSERKPLDVRIVAATTADESRTHAPDRREEARRVEPAAV